jgi:hypothetical protein
MLPKSLFHVVSTAANNSTYFSFYQFTVTTIAFVPLEVILDMAEKDSSTP